MKKLSLFIGSIFFSTLFYDKGIGLNLFLFSILTLLVLFANNRDDFKNKRILLYSSIYLATGLAVFFHDSLVAIIANFVSFFTLIGLLAQHKSSIYIHWLNGLYTTIAGWFHRNFALKQDEKTDELKKNIDYLHLAKIIFIPSIIVIIFIALYHNGNPLFSDLIDSINFSFINIKWILVSGLGFYLFSNIQKPIEVEPATAIDLKTGNSLTKTETFSMPKLKQENELGIILIALLNVLIVTFLITDIAFIITNKEISGTVFSAQVHSGINALIASIVIAIIILLYVFRGDLNFYKANTSVKRLAFTWIILNVILVLSITIKNGQYIYYFALLTNALESLCTLSLHPQGL